VGGGQVNWWLHSMETVEIGAVLKWEMWRSKGSPVEKQCTVKRNKSQTIKPEKHFAM